MKNKNKKAYKKFKKMSQLKLSQQAFKLNAAPDMEYIKTVEKLIGRKITPEKDTANYNSQVISYFIDKTMLALRDCGQKGITPTDAFKIEAHFIAEETKKAPNLHVFSLENPLNKDYEHWAFNNLVDRELRTHFILKTEALDSFDSLIDELDGLMPNFITVEEWNKLKMAISKGNERVAKNKLVFIEPEVYLGKEMRMSDKEMLKYQIAASDLLKYDLRSDGPDLIALKELVSMVKGEKVHPLSVGPGFFAKYVSELMDEDIYGVVFHVEKDKLKRIKLFTPPSVEKPLIKAQLKKWDERYAPVTAAIALCTTMEKEFSSLEKVFNSDKDKYFVVAPGRVSGPMLSLPFNYEKVSFNDVQTLAGEVFLYQKLEDKSSATRIYFVPESYENFHPYHQHGSVIFGNNDQSYHSCALAPNASFAGTYQRNLRDDFYYQDEVLFDSGYYVYWVLKMHPEKLKLTDLLEDKYQLPFIKASVNHFEETSLILDELLKSTLFQFNYLKDSDEEWIKTLKENCFKKFAPLHKRWHLRQYLTDGVGLVLKRNLGMIDKIADDAKASWAFDDAVKRLSNKKP